MSNETHAALENALRAHVADEFPGALVTGWVAQTSFETEDDFTIGQTQYLRVVPEGQSIHVALGLVEFAAIQYRADIASDD